MNGPFLLGTPLLLDSFYGVAFVPPLVMLLATRAIIERLPLANRFPKYAAHAERKKYRFAPRVW